MLINLNQLCSSSSRQKPLFEASRTLSIMWVSWKLIFIAVYIDFEPLRLCSAVFSNISWLKQLRTLISFTVTRDESPLKRSITDISNFNGITSIQLEVRSWIAHFYALKMSFQASRSVSSSSWIIKSWMKFSKKFHPKRKWKFYCYCCYQLRLLLQNQKKW